MVTETFLVNCANQRRLQIQLVAAFFGAIVLTIFAVTKLPGQQPQELMQPAPELTKINRWINSDGFTLASQKGKVVVVHFWTFGCINCRHNLPYYNKWQEDFAGKDVQIVGVHTPETAAESNVNNVATQAKKLDIKYPVAVDGASETWKAFDNHYWPSIYLVDRRGRIRYHWDGELEFGNTHGDSVLRAKISELLAEPAN